VTDVEKNAIADAIAKQMLSGSPIDKKLTEKLIKGLCEEYHEVRQGRQPSNGTKSLD
jgi:O-acetyl-ADP-ribose deacetylase (regulator of RNase III)